MSIEALPREVKSWCVDSAWDKDNGIWAQRGKCKKKYPDKYSNFPITHLIKNLQFWWFRWIYGLNEGKVVNKVSLNIEDPS